MILIIATIGLLVAAVLFLYWLGAFDLPISIAPWWMAVMAAVDGVRRADRHSRNSCPPRTCRHRLWLLHQDETFRPFFPPRAINPLVRPRLNCGASFLPASTSHPEMKSVSGSTQVKIIKPKTACISSTKPTISKIIISPLRS